MNLPVVLDIAIGLVFIYLIASLLASEIQELISTVLQWRAKHLRESIQNLLAGGYGTQKDDQLTGFIETIYNDPLIKNMNQSSRGLLGNLGQSIYRILYLIPTILGKRVFGRNTTAPSYISPETFATTLLERVGMVTLIDKLTQIRLEKFVARIIGQYESAEGNNDTGSRPIIPDDDYFKDKDYREKGGIRVLSEKAKSLAQDLNQTGETANLILTLNNKNKDFEALVEEYDDILRDFRAGEADLETCVERMREGLDVYISQIDEKISAHSSEMDSEYATSVPLSGGEKQQLTYFKKRLNALKSSTFGEKSENERAISSGKLRPNLLELAEVFDRASMTYQEIKTAYREIALAYEVSKIAEQVRPVLVFLLRMLKDPNQKVNARGNQLQPSTPGNLVARTPGNVDLLNNDANLLENDTVLLKEEYQPAINTALGSLSPAERQAYQDWKNLLQVIQAIAAQLQSQGKLFEGEVEVTEINSERLRRSVREALNQISQEMTQEEFQSYIDNQLSAMTAADQQVYKIWQFYQHHIVRVVESIAGLLKNQGRLFIGNSEVTQPLTDLDAVTLAQSVKQSLGMMSNEESQLCINTALQELSPEQRKIYRNYQTYEQIQDILQKVPTSVQQSLAILARRAQTKVVRTEKQLDQFTNEVSSWFDRSMGRASGVYKRNAKGVAIIIGFCIALVSNADTFHVVARLSGDDDLRQVITQRAGEITQTTKSDELYNRDRLRELKRNTDEVLQEISLPLRWTPANLRQQFNCPPPDLKTNPNEWRSFYRDCLNDQTVTDQGFNLLRMGEIAGRHGIDMGRIVIGWLVSGIAIAMGAPFWFDLLSKIMNVRNTGTKPSSVADKGTQKSPTT
ncbi:MAG: hypothetical protein HC866_24995 [Leptolyngbyaceae cyanobacterium RU_5_1]|nr:hypothetical protein [Leptolyngbyaceae cyanobacterium RU_5_1]